MIIQSGNDASIALAEHVAGNEETFAALMNNACHPLGNGQHQLRQQYRTARSRPLHHSTYDIAKVAS